MAYRLDRQCLPRMLAFLPVGPVKPMLADLERWAAKSGEEWTVKRVKALRQALLHFMSGDRLNAVETLRLGGIAYHRDGTPKGPWRYVFRLSEQDAFSAWNALMVYSQFKFQVITRSSWDKFLTKVTKVTYAASSEDKRVFLRGVEVLQSVYGLRPNTSLVEKILPIYHYPWSPTRRSLIGPLEFGREDRGVLDFEGLEPLMLNQRSIFERILGPEMAESIPDVSEGENIGYRGPDGFVVTANSLYRQGDYIVGSVHCIPEPGYKARVIANPRRLIQKALTPLGDWLFEQLRRLPMDATFDQEGGRRKVQGELAACNRVSSVDLTSATDSFPRLHSQELLMRLVGEPFTTFMDDLARGRWVLPYREFGHFLPKPTYRGVFPEYSDRYFRDQSWDDPVGLDPYVTMRLGAERWLGKPEPYTLPPAERRVDARGVVSYVYPDDPRVTSWAKMYEKYTQYMMEHYQPETVSWAQGQPLGTYPSFAEFALSHHAVLLGLISEMGLPHDSYVLLGDDVAVFDDGLAAAYVGMMTRFGVEINPSKGTHSSVLAEFAGHLLTADSDIPGYKWRRPSDDNFLDICRGIGSIRARALLSKRQQRVFDILRIAPEQLGGLGFNPEGIPLSERIEAFEDLQQEYVRPTTYRTPVSTLNRLLYNSMAAPGIPREPVFPDRERLVEFLRANGIYVPLEEVPTLLDENPRLREGLPISVRDALRLSLVGYADKSDTPRLDQLEIALGLRGYERQRHWLNRRRILAAAHPPSN